MVKFLRIIKRRLITKKIGDLVIGRNIKFKNRGIINSGRSTLGAGDNLTIKIINRAKKSYFYNSGELFLGNGVQIYQNFGIYIDKDAKFSIGNNTYINPEVTVICKKMISIGSDCAISWRCQFLDDDLHSIIKEGERINPTSPILIGNHVWICSDVKILPGTQIGEGVVVAAGSIVKGILEANCLYGGIPAKKIREQIEWR